MEQSPPHRTSRATMRDVSKLAGVSQATVSNYFNRPETVSLSLRTAIRGAIEELDYVRDESARLLRAGSSRTIGSIITELHNSQAVQMSTYLEELCFSNNFELLIANSRGDTNRALSYLNLFEAQRVAGVIVAPGALPEAALLEARRRGTPVVMDGRTTLEELRCVSFDEEEGGYVAVTHLIAQGCKRIAFVGGSLDVWQVARRLQGASRAASEEPTVGLEIITTRERTIEDGLQAGTQLLARDPGSLPDGIFAVNDSIAVGLLRSLAFEAGISIPENIALVGYDDSPHAAASFIPISSVHTSPKLIVTELFNQLTADAAELAGNDDTTALSTRHITISPKLVIRASSLRK